MNNNMKLWYKHPASYRSWLHALSVGNGRLGAMIYRRDETPRSRATRYLLPPKISYFADSVTFYILFRSFFHIY